MFHYLYNSEAKRASGPEGPACSEQALMVTRIYEKSGKMIENNREKIHIEALKNLQPGSSIHGRRHFEIRYLYDLFTIFFTTIIQIEPFTQLSG